MKGKLLRLHRKSGLYKKQGRVKVSEVQWMHRSVWKWQVNSVCSLGCGSTPWINAMVLINLKCGRMKSNLARKITHTYQDWKTEQYEYIFLTHILNCLCLETSSYHWYKNKWSDGIIKAAEKQKGTAEEIICSKYFKSGTKDTYWKG